VIIALFTKWFTALLKLIADGLPPFILDTPLSYVIGICRYIRSFNEFFPVSDGFVPILSLILAMCVFFLGYKIFLFTVNVVRGAGIH
jgi:hypothetical protein